MAARARGGATRGAGSAGVGSGSSTSVEPKPSAWTTPGAAARASAAPMTASWNPHPQRLRARAIAGAILCLKHTPMPDQAALLARGPWDPDEVEVHWSDDHYDAPPARVEAADAPSPRCATAARPATTAWRRDWSATP